MKKKYFDWVYEYPKFVIVRKEGWYYTARNESAEVLHNLLGYHLGNQGTGVITGCPIAEPVVEALVGAEINYIIIEDNEIVEMKEFKENVFSVDNEIYKPAYIKKVLNSTVEKKKEMLAVCDSLLMGIDPYTGEILSDNHLLNDQLLQEIILISKKTIRKKVIFESNKSDLVSLKWSEDEEKTLRDEYKEGVGIIEIAKYHNRSVGAIKSRLSRIYQDELPEHGLKLLNNEVNILSEKDIASLELSLIEESGITVEKLLEIYSYKVHGPYNWNHKIESNLPGVYFVTQGDVFCTKENVIFDKNKIEKWMIIASDMKLDCKAPSVSEIDEFLRQYWTNDEILYIGKAGGNNSGSSIGKRVNQFYIHQLGRSSPHSGGHWIKVIKSILELKVYYISVLDQEPKDFENELLIRFKEMSTSNNIPFSNLEYKDGISTIRKQDRLTNQRESRGSKPKSKGTVLD